MFYCRVKNMPIIISVCTFCFGRDYFCIKTKQTNKKKKKTTKTQKHHKTPQNQPPPKNPQGVFDLSPWSVLYQQHMRAHKGRLGKGQIQTPERILWAAMLSSPPSQKWESEELSPAPHPLTVSLPFPRKENPSPMRLQPTAPPPSWLHVWLSLVPSL